MIKKLKIAVIGKRNYLYWDSHVANTLKQMGHEIFHFQINERPLPIQVSRLFLKGFTGKKKASSVTDSWHAALLLEQLESFQPDIVFYVSSFFIPVPYYHILEKLSKKPFVIGWDGDGGPSYEINKKYIPYFDVLFETEKLYCEQNTLGFTKMVHLPFCINPDIHKNLHHKRENKIYFCGSWTPERDEIITSLIDFPVVLKGWHWKNLTKRGKDFTIETGTVDIKKQVEDYNRYKYVLNKHQAINHVHALNMRTFEAPGCGAVLLNDWRAEIESLYPEKDIVVYKNRSDLVGKLGKIFDNERENIQMSHQAYAYTHENHTYKNRMETILLECLL